jgi:proline dehydrogenase
MLDFTNTRIAYKDMTAFSLMKKKVILTLLRFPIIMTLGKKYLSLTKKLSFLPYKFFIRPTFFSQFCGGVTLEDCEGIMKIYLNKSVSCCFFYSSEHSCSNSDVQKLLEETILTIRMQNKLQADENKRFAIVKVTGLVSFDLLCRVQRGDKLSSNENIQYKEFYKKIDVLCKKAEEYNVKLMFDAEETWVQDVIDDIVLEKMKEYNKKKCVVYITLQMYRIDRPAYLSSLIKISKKENIYLGIKLVRGAYLVQENEQAKEEHRESPLFSTKRWTDKAYDDALSMCFDNLDKIYLFAGSHNEKSMCLFANYIDSKGVLGKQHAIASQLYGMSDHITFNLANASYPVCKYIPYGPIEEAIPYLIRRAQENSSISGEVQRELEYTNKELLRRLKVKC